MADEFTPNYGLFLPKGTDSMADVVRNMTDNFERIAPRADPTVIAAGGALPQVGNYEIGDRVFRADPSTSTTYPSSYILICKDVNWGWHWRPIQQVLSPWVSLTNNIINDGNYRINATYGLQVALDSRGWCHWRGVIEKIVPGIPVATSISVLKTLPVGIRPNDNFMHTVPTSPVFSAAGKPGYSGGRIFFQNDGLSSMRFYNTNNGSSKDCWLTGLRYRPSAHWYFSG